MRALILLFWLLSWTNAQEVYMHEDANGTIHFTDSPPHDGFTVFDVNGPPPKRMHVSKSNFPKIDQWDAYILEAARNYNVPPALVKAVVMAESGMNADALSKAGAQGLMQLMPATARGLKVADPWDPQQNIDGGTRYLRQNLDRFGETRLALAAYNAGPGNVRKYGGIPPFKETQVYVERVLDLYDLFLIERPIQ